MLYSNAKIFTKDGWIYGGFRTESGYMAGILPGVLSGGEDLSGAKVLPGLVDIHTHGAAGADFSDGDAEGLRKMAAYLASRGVTSFVPTSVTLPYGRLEKAFDAALHLSRSRPEGCARVAGIHMEGPYLSEKKKGAQNGAFLRAPDLPGFRKLYEGCRGLIRIADAAPELPGAAEFAAGAKDLCTVSAAHTDADYGTAAAFFDAGATHLTHLFNAMSPIRHRSPGVIGAAAEREDVTAELICDGLHVHPSIVRMAFRLFPGRICLVSDSLRCCGMPDGEYELGGQTVFLRGQAACLADGTIAGSAADLAACLKRAVAFGIPEKEAVLSATLRPAEVIGAQERIGSLEEGKHADFLVCGEDLSVKEVFIGGVRIGGVRR